MPETKPNEAAAVAVMNRAAELGHWLTIMDAHELVLAGAGIKERCAGLREAAELADSHAADDANIDEIAALRLLATAIRARIAALETEAQEK